MGSASSTGTMARQAKQSPAAPASPRLPMLGQQLTFLILLAGLVFGALALGPALQSLPHIGATSHGTFIVRHCDHQNPLTWHCSGDYVTSEQSGRDDAANVRLVNDGRQLADGTQLPASLDAGARHAYLTGLPTEVAPLLLLAMLWFLGAMVALFRKRVLLTALALLAGAPLLVISLVAIRY